MFGAISDNLTRISNCLKSADVDTTRAALQALGVSVESEGKDMLVRGVGAAGLKAPKAPLDMGNSGTTTRLLMGILAGQPFSADLFGDASLSQRPMKRVTEPLQKMGAAISGPNGSDRLPLTIQGGSLKGIRYAPAVVSAQVKSAILLAGLYAQGSTTVVEPNESRDHTERMLRYFGARLKKQNQEITIEPGARMTGRALTVPGDISSAAFFLVAAAIVPGSSVTVKGVGLNPTRTGLLDLLRAMGLRLSVRLTSDEWEPVGDVSVEHGPLKAVTVESAMVPRVIDELPIFMVAATQARGRTLIRGAGELRVKETDRIQSMVAGLSAMGAVIRSEKEDVVIEGPSRLRGATLSSFQDHRTAMALAVASLAAGESSTITEAEWVDISFPDFGRMLESIRC